MFKIDYEKIYLSIYLSISLNGQVIHSNEIEKGTGIQRNASFNVDEIKVRWKKAALENCPSVPCVTTSIPGAPTSVVATAGVASASVAFVAPTSNGGSATTGYTVTSNPGSYTATGTISPINVTGLINGTAYTFTVVATNAVGNSVPSAASVTVTPSFTCGTSTITDIDNNIYSTVSIGAQCWTKTNLKVTKYNDGTAIPLNNTYTSGTVSTVWQGLTTGAYTIYGNESSTGANATNYGFLYNWYAAKGISATGSASYKNICPASWHVPTDTEWITLTTYLGGTTTAGTVMKSTSTLWNVHSPPSPGTNTSGFSALPGGVRDNDGSFIYSIVGAFFWSATESASFYAWMRALGDSDGVANRYSHFDKTIGLRPLPQGLTI